ncbi:MAG: hypothetical protein SOT80_09335 [Candidatus Pseudoruminococcus sp.]|nr:hypothetical protein [Candidatus Pseudoruminococcus sp.]
MEKPFKTYRQQITILRNRNMIVNGTRAMRILRSAGYYNVQESSRPIGLFRVDYNASDHKNPVISNEHVPDYVKPYTNKHIYGSHVHMYVQGYKPLAWAVPIDSHDFSIKEMTGINSFYAAIDEFCDIISLQTTIQHDGRMFL